MALGQTIKNENHSQLHEGLRTTRSWPTGVVGVTSIAHNPAVARLSSYDLAVALLGALAGAAGAAPAQRADSRSIARAFAIQVAVPGVGSASAASVSAPPDAVGVGGSFAYPGDGSVISAGSVTSGAFASPGSASASAEVSSISLFRGEVTIANVTARTRAAANKRTSS